MTGTANGRRGALGLGALLLVGALWTGPALGQSGLGQSGLGQSGSARAGAGYAGAGHVGAGHVGAVRVRFVAPERFTDAEGSWGSGLPLRVTLAEMTRILEQLGQARLTPGETLDISVLDIDLAGFDRPGFSGANGLRVVTDATPPRIRLAYVLRRGGRVVAQGEDTVTDVNVMLTANPRFSTGALYYERAVLRDWFAKRFPAPKDQRD